MESQPPIWRQCRRGTQRNSPKNKQCSLFLDSASVGRSIHERSVGESSPDRPFSLTRINIEIRDRPVWRAGPCADCGADQAG